ncbi:MAG: 50S ribosomal protein L13 [Candidatus Wildermuthbacteria bacterium GWA2_46_15]|uniref:Large ribosomal subunit protein uL13 n=1 Tax=Candidatus Wildermuthbacteria bacterium GWA2_46_15 TaxID=1802443 RepID=A0A1G2QNL7_9BACT|nr:MAG: 50S ribosomal protein L13 [Candidatus Wildermuthbacteria bacterium GWA2_46_15]
MTKARIHTIDARGRSLGRLASQIAQLLRGKQSPNFLPYKESGEMVIIENVGQMVLTGKKESQKKYFSHSGYPKGAKQVPIKKILETKPEKVLRRAVFGMLPHNKLSLKIIRNLRFKKER